MYIIRHWYCIGWIYGVFITRIIWDFHRKVYSFKKIKHVLLSSSAWSKLSMSCDFFFAFGGNSNSVGTASDRSSNLLFSHFFARAGWVFNWSAVKWLAHTLENSVTLNPWRRIFRTQIFGSFGLLETNT